MHFKKLLVFTVNFLDMYMDGQTLALLVLLPISSLIFAIDTV